MTGWQQVQQAVIDRIRAGHWPPGHQIPNEADLARELGCARATVNRALRALAEEGLLERRRRAGTRVAPLPVRQARLRIPVIRAEVEAAGRRYGYRLLHRARDPLPAALRPLFPDGEMLHLIALHEADCAPYVHEDRWISLTVIPAAAGADFAALSANEWLVANAPVSDGEIAYTAGAATAAEARMFGCAEGTSLMRADRITRHDGRTVTRVALTFRPGHVLTLKL